MTRPKRTKQPQYTITDKYFPDFNVLKSDNAWWVDKGKIERLIAAFKMDAAIMEACAYAGITYEQYKYFNEIHPEFSIVKQLCNELPTLQARQEVIKGIANDKEFALKYLERKRKNEFSTKSELLHGEDPSNKFTSLADAFKALDKHKKQTDEPKA